MPLIDPITGAGTSNIPSKTSHPIIKPITPLQTTPAKIFRHVHPILLLSAYYFQFPALVRDPVETMMGMLVPLVGLQMVYAAFCLPVAQGAGKPGKKGKGGKDSVKGWKAVFPLLTSLLQTLPFIPLLLTIQILFGAPLTTHLTHTLLSSTHFATLAFYPLIYTHGSIIDWAKWRGILCLAGGWEGRDELMGGLVGVAVGAWLGAVPIPLDWDREWQRWPVTVLSGGWGGYVLGGVVGGWR